MPNSPTLWTTTSTPHERPQTRTPPEQGWLPCVEGHNICGFRLGLRNRPKGYSSLAMRRGDAHGALKSTAHKERQIGNYKSIMARVS